MRCCCIWNLGLFSSSIHPLCAKKWKLEHACSLIFKPSVGSTIGRCREKQVVREDAFLLAKKLACLSFPTCIGLRRILGHTWKSHHDMKEAPTSKRICFFFCAFGGYYLYTGKTKSMGGRRQRRAGRPSAPEPTHMVRWRWPLFQDRLGGEEPRGKILSRHPWTRPNEEQKDPVAQRSITDMV